MSADVPAAGGSGDGSADAPAGGGHRPARVVDALGRACPLPVIWLAKAIDDVAAGDEVVVLADDPGAKVDIPVWCRMRRQEHLATEEADSGWRFTVRRIT